jgi:hypothetical protein
MVSRLNLALRSNEYRYIFILGHMRSGSTLLAHVLGSHPDVVSAGEMHISYVTPDDLPKLVLKTSESLFRPILRESYIVDQINHGYVTNEVLLSPRLYKCVLLIRSPEATLKSMMHLAEWHEKQALEVYVKRLRELTQYGLTLRDRASVVEYDHLVDRSDETLAALSRFLVLGPPLKSNYQTHRMTGRVAGYGDPSANIRLGRIVRTQRHETTISEETLSAAERAFHECREQLRSVTSQAPSTSNM